MAKTDLGKIIHKIQKTCHLQFLILVVRLLKTSLVSFLLLLFSTFIQHIEPIKKT